MSTETMYDAIQRRVDLTERLIVALNHLPQPRAVSIVSSFIPLRDLAKVVEFQEERS
jgi:hypothetical protein